MSDLLLGLIGAGIGLAVALMGNVLVLPMVLRRQRARIDDGWRMPVFGWDQASLMRHTKFMYRVPMPVFFSIIGATSTVAQFGSDR